MESKIFNEDCMIGMARYPDKFFDLAVVTPKYVYLYNENIKRITNRQSGGISGLRRFNNERVCCISERTGTTIRCITGYRGKDISGSGENNIFATNYSATFKGNTLLYFQYKKGWEKKQENISVKRSGFICACLFGDKESGLYNIFQYARNISVKSGFASGIVLRRKRGYGLSKSIVAKREDVSNKYSKEFKHTRSASKQNAEGGLYSL